MSDISSTAIDHLRIEMQSWSSIELKVSVRQENQNLPAFVTDPLAHFVQHYIETARGQRLLDEIRTMASGKATRDAYYSDGERCAHVRFDPNDSSVQTKIDISDHFSYENEIGATRRPDPLGYYYIGKEPIYEALRNAKPLGDGEAAGRACDRFLFQGVKLSAVPLDAVYYLDHETSMPLRIEYYRAGGQHDSEEAIQIWEAQSLDQVGGGHHLPLKSTNQFFRKTSSGLVPLGSNEIVIEEIHYDRPFAASTFWPTYQPGVQVIDRLKKKTITIPGPARPKPAETTVAVPVQAEPPTPWTTYASYSILGLGLALIGVAVALRLRRA